MRKPKLQGSTGIKQQRKDLLPAHQVQVVHPRKEEERLIETIWGSEYNSHHVYFLFHGLSSVPASIFSSSWYLPGTVAEPGVPGISVLP